MKIFSLFAGAALSFAVLSASAATAATQQDFEQAVAQEPRQLQSLDTVCLVCPVCDTIGCDFDNVLSQLCTLCGNAALNVPDQVCDVCTTCSSDPDCDADVLVEIGCTICDTVDDGGGGDDVDIGEDSCFSELSTVQVLDTGSVAMKDLNVGDYVLTTSNKYEEVYAFAHFYPSKPASFFQIYSENTDRPLEVTGDHLIFLQGKKDPVPSQAIQVGDVLRIGDSQTGSTVTEIKNVDRKGIYAPLTTGGTLLVDGVAASSYIYLEENMSFVSDQYLLQLSLSPFRMLCQGVSSKFCDTSSYNEDGMPYYVQYGLEILRWVLGGNFVTRAVGFAIVLLFLGFCQLAEGIFGSYYAPLAAFLLVTFGASTLKTRKAKSL